MHGGQLSLSTAQAAGHHSAQVCGLAPCLVRDLIRAHLSHQRINALRQQVPHHLRVCNELLPNEIGNPTAHLAPRLCEQIFNKAKSLQGKALQQRVLQGQAETSLWLRCTLQTAPKCALSPDDLLREQLSPS